MKYKFAYLILLLTINLVWCNRCDAQPDPNDTEYFSISITKDTVKNIEEDKFYYVWITPDNSDSLVMDFDTLKNNRLYKINANRLKHKFSFVLLSGDEVMQIKITKNKQEYPRFYLDKLVFKPGTYQINVPALAGSMTPYNWDDIRVCEPGK